jgi:hypothetical protein
VFLFLLRRRLSPRGLRNVGLGLIAAGLALVAVSATLAAGLLVHGLAVAVAGAVALAYGLASSRRARHGHQNSSGGGLHPTAGPERQ